MESLVEELTCPVCLELYEQPVLLPCTHSLCKRCTQHVFAEVVRKPPQQGAGQGAAPKQVQCPSCRHEFQLPELGAEGLRRNITLQNIVDRYREAKTNTAAPKPVPCQMCDQEPPAEAVKTCLVCDTSYCEACLSKYHPMRAGLARHTLTEASAAAPKVLMCTEHAQEKVTMYCEADGCLICYICKLVGKHKDHEVAALSDTFQQKRDSIGGRVAGLIQQNAEVECFVDNIQKTMTQTQKNCAGIKRSVDAFADKLAFAMAKRKSELHSKVEEESNQKLGTLAQQLNLWRNTGTGITAAIAEAETLLNEEDPITFLQASRMVEDRLAAFAHLNERKLKTTGQFTNNTVVVSDLEQKIWSLDFLQVPEAPRILIRQCTAGHDYITVSWAAGGNTPVDKYSFWYRKANQSGWQGSFVTTNTSIRLKPLEENTAYSAVVVATNAAGNAESTTVNIKTKRRGLLKFKLDKNTAQQPMVVADDGMSVTWSQASNRSSAHGYRYGEAHTGVLGDAAIKNGRCYWEVNVTGSFDFGVGVAYKRQQLGGMHGAFGFSRSFANQQCRNESMMYASGYDYGSNDEKMYDLYYVGMNGNEVDPFEASHSTDRLLTKVGILLDYNASTISYYDQNHSLITSQTEQFSQPVYPCFVVKDQGGTLSLVQDCVWPDGLE